MNYTLGKSEATQGGDLSAYYIASFENNQDFWDPEFDRGPSSNDIRHRLNASFIYELPTFGGGQGVTNGVLGGWQISGIVQTRSGNALLITQPSGINRSRPDVVEGVDLIVADWQDTCTAAGCNYLNTAGFVQSADQRDDERDAPAGHLQSRYGARAVEPERTHDVREELRAWRRTAGCRFAPRSSTC